MNHVNHEEIYSRIRHGVTVILENGMTTTSNSFIGLFAHIRSYCEHSAIRSQRLYDRVCGIVREHVNRHAQMAGSLVGEDLLHFYLHEWFTFKFKANMISNICSYLNTSWIRPQRQELNINLPGIVKSSYIIWRVVMLSTLGQALSSSVISLLNLERTGNKNDNKIIREFMDALIELGLLVEVEPGEMYFGPEVVFSVYVSEFERLFLDLTLDLYKKESTGYFLSHSVMDYVQYAEKIIVSEEALLVKYLPLMTVTKLVNICIQEFIGSRETLLKGEYSTQSLNSNIIQMGQLYLLSKRLTDGFADNFMEFLKDDIANRQSVIIAKYKKAIKAGRQLGPRDYVSVIYNTYRTYDDNVITRHQQFAEWFFGFVNNEYIIRLVGASLKLRTSASILAVYCDMEMRRSTTTLSSIGSNAFVQRVMIVYHYLRDKDQFLRNHRALLARRLATRSSIINVEILLIEELIKASGLQITLKIRKLISEFFISEKTERDYKRFLAVNDMTQIVPYEFNISVFSSSVWPGAVSLPTISLPKELTSSMANFTLFYNQVHSGRKLEWLHDVSSVEVITNCFEKTYTFHTSPIHVVILFMFNGRDSNTIREIADHTKIPIPLVIHAVRSLVKINILLFNGRESDLNSESVVMLNTAFTYHKMLIKIKPPSNAILPQEQNQIATANENVTRATIVRFMKVRPLLFLSQSDLFTIISKELSQNQLKLEKVMFKKCLEDLIEKDYIERTGERVFLYRYKP